MLYQTHAKVYLSNIRENIAHIRQAIGPERRILVAVKANAYGHGAIEVGKVCEEIGVNWLGVATAPEAISLRQAGITLPILKFTTTFPEEMAELLAHGITLSVGDKENATAIEVICQAHHQKATVHIKVDTGMGRLGSKPNDATDLALHIEKNCPHLHLQGIFTHLPVSDAADPTFTHNQIELFKQTCEEVHAAIGRRLELRHCSNSGGVLGHQEGWLDMIRPGIMVYGYYPDKETPRSIELKPALSMHTRVSFIKEVEAGTPIGYGCTWTAPEKTWIATIPVGYADGFNRLWSNKGRVLIGGQSYPIVGRVCMDQSMVNLGPQTDVRVGDRVTLIGLDGDQEITAYEWAEKLGTITYEVTSQINARVGRVYEGAEPEA